MAVPQEPAGAGGEGNGDGAPPPAKKARCDGAEGGEPPAGAGGQAAPVAGAGAVQAPAVAGAAPAGRGDAAPAPSPGPAAEKTGQPTPPDPPAYASGGYVQADGGWWAHSSNLWLYNPEEKTYFHLPSGRLCMTSDEEEEDDEPAGAGAAGKTAGGSAATAAAGGAAAGGGPASAAPGAAGAAPADAEVATLVGKVKFFKPFKGFGFLEPLREGTGQEDVFFHKNQLVGDDIDLQSIRPGVEVTYSMGETDDGRKCAVRVKLAGQPGAGKNGKDAGAEGKEDAEEGAEDDEGEEGEEEAEDGQGSSSGESVDIDLFEELHSGMYQAKGDAKDQCEDFAVDKVKIPISVLGETATCVFFGVFDGHGGANCAEYAATHLAKNVLARLRDRTKSANDETALKTALLGGFKQTEHNFLQHARRQGDVSGSTACTMTVFGPDEEMRLRLFLANAGDSRAVLGKAGGGFLRLTEDHKPNLPAEKKRVELEGGSVVEVAGVWRAILPQKRRVPGIIGLAVSRALGDKDFKGPNIVSPDPDITIHEVNWDDDEFVILATDGVWDVISDKDAVRMVQRSLRQFSNEEKAAEELVQRARQRGSKDDCTAMVVRFGWLKRKEGEEGAADENASDQEDEDGAAEGGAPEARLGRSRTVNTQEGKRAGAAPADGQEKLGEDEEDEDMDDEDEEEEDDDDEDEEEEGGGMPSGPPGTSSSSRAPAVAAAAGAAADDDDSDDDIFAALADNKGGKEKEAAPVIPTPAADSSGLFDDLGPTQEEMPGFLGPTRPEAGPLAAAPGAEQDPAKEGKEKVAPGGAGLPPKEAVDGDLDMFGGA